MSAEIIQFGKPSVAARQVDAIAFCLGEAPRKKDTRPKRVLTLTARNRQTRHARKDAWRQARAVTEYWHASLRFHDAVWMAAREGMKGAILQYRELNNESRSRVLDNYRAAVCAQIFTAAPDLAAVSWKRSHVDQALFVGAKRERIEQVIADDVSFLKSHPTTRRVCAAEA